MLLRSPCSSIPTYLQEEENQTDIILSIPFWTSDECFRKQNIMCTKKCVTMWMVNKNNSCNNPPPTKHKHAHYSWSEDRQAQWIYKVRGLEPEPWKHRKMAAIKCPCCYGAKHIWTQPGSQLTLPNTYTTVHKTQMCHRYQVIRNVCIMAWNALWWKQLRYNF